MQATSDPQVFLFGHKRTQTCFRGFFNANERGGLEEWRPILTKMGLSTLAWHVSRRPEEQRTSFNQSIPRRFYSCLAAIALPFFTCKTQISPSVCINGLPYHKMESSDIACTPERGAKMWTRACNLPVHRRFSCLTTKRNQACFRGFFQCKWEGWA